MSEDYQAFLFEEFGIFRPLKEDLPDIKTYFKRNGVSVDHDGWSVLIVSERRSLDIVRAALHLYDIDSAYVRDKRDSKLTTMKE